MQINGKLIKKTKKYNSILHVAESLFFQHGIKRISIEEICSVANVSKMTFYKYFKNKDDIVKVIFSSYYDEGMEKFEEIEKMDISFLGKVDLLLKMKKELTQNMSSTFIIDYLQINPGLKEFFERYRQKGLDRFILFLKRAEEKGEIRKGIKPEMLIAIINKLTELATNEELISYYDSYADFVLEINNFLAFGLMPIRTSNETE